MPALKSTIRLQVPAELAFRYLSSPSHLTDYCPNLLEISALRQYREGASFAWVYQMMGTCFFGRAEMAVTRYNQQLNIRFWGGIRGHVTWTLDAADKATFLSFKADYITPLPLLKAYTEEAIFHQNEQNAEYMLSRLKAQLETFDQPTHLAL